MVELISISRRALQIRAITQLAGERANDQNRREHRQHFEYVMQADGLRHAPKDQGIQESPEEAECVEHANPLTPRAFIGAFRHGMVDIGTDGPNVNTQQDCRRRRKQQSRAPATQRERCGLSQQPERQSPAGG